MKIYTYRVHLLISFNLSMKFPLTSAFHITHLHILNFCVQVWIQRTHCSLMKDLTEAWTLATQSWWTLSTQPVAFSA